MHGVVPSQVQNFAHPLVVLHEVLVGPFLQPLEVSLDGCMALCVGHYSQFGVLCKLAEGGLCLTIHVINENVEQAWSQY